MKRRTFDGWAIMRLREKAMCRVERSMTCLPLKKDPICQACYESDDPTNPPFKGQRGKAPLNPKEKES